ncbi:MAG: Glutamine--fructose-6-phosphate aminotransferase (isomerizing) [Alphaproteobacteria bacterium ADurb.Bin438]|nr:MAG: Glutamine--fructose-6-phosphate aminotransferase (isomerizing) [Alphaproteobacteria bacterium ADurb.Bin438]
MIVGVKKDSPLAVSETDKGLYIGSDAIALSLFNNEITYLEDGDIVSVIKDKGVTIYDKDDNEIVRKSQKIAFVSDDLDMGNFQSYMIKEMSEQPVTVAKTLSSIFDDANKKIKLPEMGVDFDKLEHIKIVACGTSYHAGLLAKYWIEEFCPIYVEVDVASEFRYRKPHFKEGGLAIFLSQSGETADTLAALRYCKENKQKILSIVNVPQSTIARESDAVLYTLAGAEICVASTKSLTAQMILLLGLIVGIAAKKGKITSKQEDDLLKQMFMIPSLIEDVLSVSEGIKGIAEKYIKNAEKMLFLGRGYLFPISLEGALKMKELSYIPSEGYAAGEMKHGPIALIDNKTPVVVVAPSNALSEKTASNMQEVSARGGKVILITDKKGKELYQKSASEVILIPSSLDILYPFASVVALQFLSYYTATSKGLDVDKPRNLAKSVTVE